MGKSFTEGEQREGEEIKSSARVGPTDELATFPALPLLVPKARQRK